MQERQVPQTLDQPPIALFFNVNQLSAFLGGSMIGVMIGELLICSIIGAVVAIFINKFSDKMPRGYLRHLLYHHGVPVLTGKRMPHGLDREFRP